MVARGYCRNTQGVVMALEMGGSAAIVFPPGSVGQVVDAPRGGSEEILVTARKRKERVQDIPVVVNALSAEQIARADLTNPERVAASTPQLTVGRAVSGSGTQVTLRGIGSNFASINIKRSVAVVMHGVGPLHQ